jgi:ADP-dependent phosphofructokinase/glucokinase
MANVLALEGAEVVLNVPVLTPKQASFLDSMIKVPDSIGKCPG